MCQRCSLKYTRRMSCCKHMNFCGITKIKVMNCLITLSKMKRGFHIQLWQAAVSKVAAYIIPETRDGQQDHSVKKLVATFFFLDRKGVLIVNFSDPWTTVNADIYCKMLKKLIRAIQSKRCRMLSPWILFLYDNVWPSHTQKIRQWGNWNSFVWEIYHHLKRRLAL